MSKHLHIQIPDNAVRVDIRVILIDLDPEPLAPALRIPLAPTGIRIVPSRGARHRWAQSLQSSARMPATAAALQARFQAMAAAFATSSEEMARRRAKGRPAQSPEAGTPSPAAVDDMARGENSTTREDCERLYRQLSHLLQAHDGAANHQGEGATRAAAAPSTATAPAAMASAGAAGAMGRTGAAGKRDASPARVRPAAQERPAAPHPRPHRWLLEAKAAPRTPRLHLRHRPAANPTRKP